MHSVCVYVCVYVCVGGWCMKMWGFNQTWDSSVYYVWKEVFLVGIRPCKFGDVDEIVLV